MTSIDVRERGDVRGLIDLSADDALQDWAEKLGVSQRKILEAIQAVGNNANRVRDYVAGSRADMNGTRSRSTGAG